MAVMVVYNGMLLAAGTSVLSDGLMGPSFMAVMVVYSGMLLAAGTLFLSDGLMGPSFMAVMVVYNGVLLAAGTSVLSDGLMGPPRRAPFTHLRLPPDNRWAMPCRINSRKESQKHV